MLLLNYEAIARSFLSTLFVEDSFFEIVFSDFTWNTGALQRQIYEATQI